MLIFIGIFSLEGFLGDLHSYLYHLLLFIKMGRWIQTAFSASSSYPIMWLLWRSVWFTNGQDALVKRLVVQGKQKPVICTLLSALRDSFGFCVTRQQSSSFLLSNLVLTTCPSVCLASGLKGFPILANMSFQLL